MKTKTVLVLNGEDLVNKLSLPKHYKFSGAFYNTFEKLVELTFDIEEEAKKEEKHYTCLVCKKSVIWSWMMNADKCITCHDEELVKQLHRK